MTIDELKAHAIRNKIPLTKNGTPQWPYAFRTWQGDLTCDDNTILSEREVKQLLHYHFNPRLDHPDSFYRSQGLNMGNLTHYGEKMLKLVPVDYVAKEHPWDWGRFPSPDCPKCNGQGGRKYPVPRGPKGFTHFKLCSCISSPAQADLNCKKCRGNGNWTTRVDRPDEPAGVAYIISKCDCWR